MNKSLITASSTAAFAICFTVNVFAQAPEQKPTGIQQNFFGSVQSGKYVNGYFGFSLSIPDNFTVMDNEQSKVFMNAGVDLLKGTDKNSSDRIDAAVAKQATLLSIFQKPVGSPENAVVEIQVVKQGQGVTASMALAASVSLMTTSGKYKLARSLTNAKFGKLPFAGALMHGEFNSIKLSQEMYVIMRRGYSIVIGVTYATESGRQNMHAIMESIDFTQ